MWAQLFTDFCVKEYQFMEQIKAPLGETIEMRQIIHDSGIPLLRVLIREDEHFSHLDLDPATAHRWGKLMQVWAEEAIKKGV
ncbi:hypothetical protein SAMN05216526_0660 [Ectothiorhodosinus mongolicus]|uniref:Uncharacterized protein n=1 Tax=Ectothiorhodosinus mongolicus TaxID=233100 RepID=A0A1R3VPQ7_9GAMM|nr:hypothetical protein SAMN05216526_0660 [Ectothiorhodosinus mongolicus]